MVNYFFYSFNHPFVQEGAFKILNMLFSSVKMTDKELDEAITNHLKEIEALDEVTRQNTPEKKSCEAFWKGYSMSGDCPKNATKINRVATPDWKCKTPYSMKNPKKYPNIADNPPIKQQLTENTHRDKNILYKIRNRLADYQTAHEIPNSPFSFSALMKIMGQATGKSILAIFYVIVNIAPIAQILLCTVRFILDKMINLQETSDRQEIFGKSLILSLQLTCVYLCLTFIFGLIWMPILSMSLEIIYRCSMYN